MQPGNIVDYSMDMSDQSVNTVSDLFIRFSPLHSLRKEDTILTVEIDADFGLGTTDCPNLAAEDAYELNSELFVKGFQATCALSADSKTRSIQIKDPFTYTYEYTEGQPPLELVLRQTKSTRSARPIKLLRITFTNNDGQVIDRMSNEENDPTLFTVFAAPFSATLLEVDETETYTKAVFDFTLSITVPL